MPALILFHRKWLIACDDLVIPYAIEAVLRIIWICGTSVMIWLDYTNTSDSVFTEYFLYVLMGELLVTVCLCIGISIVSSKGSVLEVHKRKHLSWFLYSKFVFIFCDLALACYLIWLLGYGPSLSFRWKIFSEAICVCLFLYLLVTIIAYFVSFNSLGSSIYWNKNDSVNSVKIFKKAERIWRLRLKFFCCCADISEEENDFIYVEVANFLATFSNDIDLAPTDVLAGLIILSRKHVIERRKKKHQQNFKLDSLIENKPIPSWMTAENAISYLRIAKSTYGWLAFFDSLRPWKLCSLLSPRCMTSWSNSTKQGDCCNCNTAALEKITGLSDSDILYVSFSNSIYEPAFAVTIHHHNKAIVIAVRGTRSFSDLITDIDAEETCFPDEISSKTLKCHRGALRSSLFIYRRIKELNLLKVAFAENPTYTLVLTGHSLGASIASILGLILLPEYPSLQCYSYAPLAVLSAEGIPKTFDFVFSVVVGDDMVPQLSVHSCKELFRQLHKSLEETQLPKYQILMKSFLHYMKKSLKISRKALSKSEIYENKVEEESPTVNVDITVDTKEAQLYAPGRILHLRKAEGFNYTWITGFDLQNIIISPHIIKDHQPHEIQNMLDTYKSSTDTLERESCTIRL